MPISAISATPAMAVPTAVEAPYRPTEQAPAADTVSVSSQAKNLAAPAQDVELDPDTLSTLGAIGSSMASSLGNLGMVHDFDPERLQHILKLLE